MVGEKIIFLQMHNAILQRVKWFPPRPLLGRAAPAPYFHHFFFIFQIPHSGGGNPPSFKKGGSKLCILYSEINHLAEFDVIIQSGFKINSKNVLLIYARHHLAIIILFSQLLLWIEKVWEGELQNSEYFILTKTAF